MIIEFHKRDTRSGPPVEMRISKEDLEQFGHVNNLITIEKFELGDNFYGSIFRV